MEVDLAPEVTLMENPIIHRGQLTRNMLDTNAPYQHTAMRDSTPVRDTTDDEAMDEPKEGELVYKKTKRGRHSGHKIQGYQRRDEEQEERRRRRQGRR